MSYSSKRPDAYLKFRRKGGARVRRRGRPLVRRSCDESVAVEANKVLNSVAIETGGGGRGRLFNILV